MCKWHTQILNKSILRIDDTSFLLGSNEDSQLSLECDLQSPTPPLYIQKGITKVTLSKCHSAVFKSFTLRPMRQTGNTFEHKKLNATALLQAVTENTNVSGILHALDKIGFVQSTDDLIKSQLHGKIDPGISHVVSTIITLMTVLLLV